MPEDYSLVVSGRQQAWQRHYLGVTVKGKALMERHDRMPIRISAGSVRGSRLRDFFIIKARISNRLLPAPRSPEFLRHDRFFRCAGRICDYTQP